MDVVVVSFLTVVVTLTCLGGGVHAAESNGVAVKHRGRALDAELIRLHLEEFRMEVIQMKNQLARMSRNSKIVQTILKELRSNRCSSAPHTMERKFKVVITCSRSSDRNDARIIRRLSMLDVKVA